MKYFMLNLVLMISFVTASDRVEKGTEDNCLKYTVTDANGYKGSVWYNLKTKEIWLDYQFPCKIDEKFFPEYVFGTFGRQENFYYYLRNKYYEQLSNNNSTVSSPKNTVLNTGRVQDRKYTSDKSEQ